MAQPIGSVNQCRCGEGYYETEETVKAGMCQPCIDHTKQRDAQWHEDCALYGCPFCMKLGCYGSCIKDPIV